MRLVWWDKRLRDHSVFAASTPGGMTVAGPVEGLTLATAGEGDLAELLVLQRCCWVQEALANRSLDLPPLSETLEDVRQWVGTWQVWCVRRHGRLIAAVRARADGSVWQIGRLMVAPDHAGNGIGSWLLSHAEQHAAKGTSELALCTGRRSRRNIDLYQRLGYRLIPTAAPDPTSVYLTKQRSDAQTTGGEVAYGRA
jgi:GNAT superfamily N-acetyltransferase